MSFNRFLELIRQGEPVSPGVTNRAPRAIQGNVNYLWELIQAANLGSAIYARNVSVEAAALEGMPVYFNRSRLQFERGLAQLDSIAGSAALQTAESAHIWGIVSVKHNSTLADLLIGGYAAEDIAPSLGLSAGTAVPAGLYYLSGVTPGRLTLQRPPVSVPVLRADGNGNVLLMPTFTDLIDRHQHYQFELICRPAGHSSQPVLGSRHVISESDTSKQGWLPANHPIFAGRAPTAAAWGYNLTAHTELQALWPPLPLSAAHLEWDRGEEEDQGYHGVPLGSSGLCVLNQYGIWWMSDCYGDVPWPTDLNTDISDSLSESESDNPECPRELSMRLVLSFSRALFATDNTTVTRLTTKSTRVKLYAEGTTTPSMAGALDLHLDLSDFIDEDDADATDISAYAVKALDDNTFRRGPVVTGLYPDDDSVTLSGDDEVLQDPDGPVDGDTMHIGRVGVRLNQLAQPELPVTVAVTAGSAEEDSFADLTYLNLPASATSSYQGRIDVPSNLSVEEPRLHLRLRLLGRVAGVLPSLTVTGRRIPRPATVLTATPALPLAAADFTIVLNTAATLTATNQYVEVESDDFEVSPGDTIFFTVERESDSYTGDIGVLRQTGVLTSGASEA